MIIKEFRKLLLLSDGAFFLVEFELWNRSTKLSFPNRVSLVRRRRFMNNGEVKYRVMPLMGGESYLRERNQRV